MVCRSKKVVFRFSAEQRQERNPYLFLAFSHGPRMCIANRLAMMEMKLAIAKVLLKYKLVKNEKTEVSRLDSCIQSYCLIHIYKLTWLYLPIYHTHNNVKNYNNFKKYFVFTRQIPITLQSKSFFLRTNHGAWLSVAPRDQ